MTGDHGHGHDRAHEHEHDHDVDWAAMADQLERSGELQLPALRRVADHLRGRFGPGTAVRRVLDVGSGPGVMTCVLAETFPEAEVVAVDGAPALLERALHRAGRLGLAERVVARHARLPEDLGADGRHGRAGLGPADLVWSSKVVHHLGDQQAALDSLVGLLRPGGLLAVVEGGLPLRYLPRDIGIGRPGLQARLDVLQEQWFDDMRAELPGSTRVVEDWSAMLGRAGLTAVRSATSLLDLPAPLDGTARAFLQAYLTRLRDTAGEALDPEDRSTLDVLTDAAAPEGVLQRPDVFLLSATTVVSGLRPAT